MTSAIPLLFERSQQVIEQTRESLFYFTGLRRTEGFDFFDREQRVSGFDDPFAQGQMALRLPGQAGFNFLQNRGYGCRQVSFEKVADENRMHHDLAGPGRGRPLLGRRPCEKRNPIHQVQQAVVVPGDEAFRENGQGKSGVGQNAGGAFERLAIQAFAVNAEAADAR